MSTKKSTKKAAPKRAKRTKAAPAKKSKPAGNGKPKKLSALDAAAQVLAASKEPLNASR